MTQVFMDITGAHATARKTGLLTAGMVGVPVQFSFSPEWEALNCLAVFRAGEVKKDNTITGGCSVIPAEVLQQPGQRLYIGVEGRSEQGDVVIPTVWAEVGQILEGAQASNDSGLGSTSIQFEQLLAQVDEKIESALQEAKDSGRFDGPPGDDYVLTAADKAEIAKQVAGLSSKEKGLMLTLFKNMLSQKDMSDTVNELEKTWATGGNDNTGGGSGETPDVPDEPDMPVEPDVPDTPETYSITYHLTNVTAANNITSMIGGNSFSTTLEADENYKLGDVTVTMGGIEVTDSVYADGVITISSVTGNIVISAVGVEMGDATAWEDGVPYTLTIIPGEYVSPEDGSICVNPDDARTDFTPCLGVDGLYFNNPDKYNTRRYNAFFDENKNFISGFRMYNTIYLEIPSNAAYFVISYYPVVTSGECTVTPLAKTEGTWEDGVPYELAPFAQDYWYRRGSGELVYEPGCNWKATEKLNCANASKLVLNQATGYGAFYDKLGNYVGGDNMWKELTELQVPRFATHFAVSKDNAFMDSLVVTPYA